MAAVMEAHLREQEVLDKLLPHINEITQEPGETERDVLTRMFTSPELGQGATTSSSACSVTNTAASPTVPSVRHGRPDPGRPHRRA